MEKGGKREKKSDAHGIHGILVVLPVMHRCKLDNDVILSHGLHGRELRETILLEVVGMRTDLIHHL